VTAGKGFVEVAASSEIVWRMYIRYGPGPVKSLCTMSSKLFECQWLNVQFPVQILIHLLLHLADLLQMKHPLQGK